MKINIKVVFTIIVVSSFLGLTYNYFSLAGIPLIPDKKTLNWADDSLFNSITQYEVETTDSNLNEVIRQEEKEEPPNDFPEQNQKSTKNEKETKTETGKDEAVLTEPVAIDLKQAYHLFEQNILFIDAREPEDYKIAHIKNAINIPFDHFDDYKNTLDEIDRNQQIVIYCAGTDCDLSILLGNILSESGYKRVYIFFGGWNEWIEANFPVNESGNEK